ncbi:DUF4044 domain-containing protein [Pediococcus ethanolidurans]|nr:DUF4044 domain-containing protein [Pediococcus ethanolidurans]MCV3328061.1 DUF4044 domain-containing protein [Pediococcus ethanolidurans]
MKKKKSTFQKIIMAVVWIMIISMIGSVVLGAVSAFTG